MIGGAVLAFSPPASAQSGGGVVQDLLGGFGVLKKEQPEIDYRERPALVVPPSRDLPAPQDGVSSAANPAWPTDPDKVRREQALIEKNRPAGTDDKARLQLDPRLSPDELRAGRIAGAPRMEEIPVGNRDNPMISPTELKRGSDAYREQKKERGRLADRPRLSDPPVAYLQPSPNAPLAPDGKDPQQPKKSWFSKINPFD